MKYKNLYLKKTAAANNNPLEIKLSHNSPLEIKLSHKLHQAINDTVYQRFGGTLYYSMIVLLRYREKRAGCNTICKCFLMLSNRQSLRRRLACSRESLLALCQRHEGYANRASPSLAPQMFSEGLSRALGSRPHYCLLDSRGPPRIGW